MTKNFRYRQNLTRVSEISENQTIPHTCWSWKSRKTSKDVLKSPWKLIQVSFFLEICMLLLRMIIYTIFLQYYIKRYWSPWKNQNGGPQEWSVINIRNMKFLFLFDLLCSFMFMQWNNQGNYIKFSFFKRGSARPIART